MEKVLQVLEKHRANIAAFNNVAWQEDTDALTKAIAILKAAKATVIPLGDTIENHRTSQSWSLEEVANIEALLALLSE